jgi:hypothetical protein
MVTLLHNEIRMAPSDKTLAPAAVPTPEIYCAVIGGKLRWLSDGPRVERQGVKREHGEIFGSRPWLPPQL